MGTPIPGGRQVAIQSLLKLLSQPAQQDAFYAVQISGNWMIWMPKFLGSEGLFQLALGQQTWLEMLEVMEAFMGTSCINGEFSLATFDYQR